MRVLIIGGAGFLGSYLARDVVARGDYAVVLDVQTDDVPFTWILSPEDRAGVTLVNGDGGDPTFLLRLLREHQIDRIVHLARNGSPDSESEPYATTRINVLDSILVFEAVRAGFVEAAVWTSSTQVFGKHTAYAAEFGVDRLVDTGPHRPYDLYSATKSFGEELVAHYHRRWQTDIRGVRPIGTFGPGRRGGHVGHITRMIYHAVAGAPYRCPSGDMALPLAYVEDSAGGLAAALYHDGPELAGLTHTIGGHSTTHREVADIIRRLVPGADIVVEDGDGGEPLTLLQENKPFREITGFELRHSLEDGIRNTVDFFRSGNSAGQVVLAP